MKIFIVESCFIFWIKNISRRNSQYRLYYIEYIIKGSIVWSIYHRWYENTCCLTMGLKIWFADRWEFLSWNFEIHFLSLLWFRWNYILIWRKFHKNKRNNKTQLSFGFRIFFEAWTLLIKSQSGVRIPDGGRLSIASCGVRVKWPSERRTLLYISCLLYTSDAADE